jgi:hypothetical protein
MIVPSSRGEADDFRERIPGQGGGMARWGFKPVFSEKGVPVLTWADLSAVLRTDEHEYADRCVRDDAEGRRRVPRLLSI